MERGFTRRLQRPPLHSDGQASRSIVADSYVLSLPSANRSLLLAHAFRYRIAAHPQPPNRLPIKEAVANSPFRV